MNNLPETGFLRIQQIIGQREITRVQAEHNRRLNELAVAQAIASGLVRGDGRPKYKHLPSLPRPAITPLFPVSKTSWWMGIKEGKYPSPIRLGGTSVWRVEDIRALIVSAGSDSQPESK